MRGILRGVARSRPLRALGVGVAIAAVLPWAAAERAALAAVQPPAQAAALEAVGNLAPWFGSSETAPFTLTSDDPPEISVANAEVSEGNAGSSHMNFEVTLDHGVSDPVSVHYATEEGSACCDEISDFAPTQGTLTFSPNQVSKTVPVPVNGDVLGELHEDFFLVLSEATNASVAHGEARGLILNDDGDCTYDQGAKSVQLPVDSAESILFVAGGWINADNASCGTADVTNTDTISITGGSGDDSVVIDLFSGEAFAPGALPEGVGSEIELAVDLGGGHNSLTVSGSDVADDELVIGANGINLNAADEVGSPDADVTITGLLERLAVNGNHGDDRISGLGGAGTGAASIRDLTLSGSPGDDEVTGGAGVDQIIGGEGEDELTGGAGIDTADFSGTPNGVQVDLAAGTAEGDGSDVLAGVENVTGSDSDDVLAGSPSANVLDGGPGEDTAVFMSSASGVSANLSTGTATGDGSDTLAGIENVTGSAHMDTITGNGLPNRLQGGAGADIVRGGAGDDALGMRDGAADTQISCGAGDNDIAGVDVGIDSPDPDCEILEVDDPVVGFGHDQTADEGDAMAFSVDLSHASSVTVTVRVQTAAAPGTEADDFTSIDQVLTFAPGELSQEVPVETTEDPIDEPDEGFTVTLSTPTGASIDAGETTGTILDDDDAPSAGIAPVSAQEGEPVNLVVSLSNPSESAVNIDAMTIGGGTASAGGDYTTVPSQTLTFAPLDTSEDFAVATVEDRLDEPDETFLAALSAGGSAIATILDDDSTPVAAGQSVTTAEDTVVTITLGAANDADGDVVTYELVGDQPDLGTLSAIVGNQVTYTPHVNVNGADDFAFRGSDGMNVSGNATISITVNAVNDRPVAQVQALTTPNGAPVAITLTAIDVDGPSPLTYAIAAGPTKGELSGTGPSRTYTPRPGESGADSFTFTASDGVIDSVPATVSITIGAAPAPPTQPPPPPGPKPRHGLTVARSGTGAGTVRSLPGINCGTDCTEEFEAGTLVTLTAAPAAGSRLTAWAGACSGTALMCTVGMDAAKAVTATFTKTVLRTTKFKPVKVCHKRKTITVRSKKDLNRHLKHKDKRGACKPKKKTRN